MRHRGILGSCSVAALCAMAAPAFSQADVPSVSARATPAQDRTSVPTNSDEADRTRAIENIVQDTPDAASSLRKDLAAPNDGSDARPTSSPKIDGTDTITVTASRLRDGDATTRLSVITAEDIRARGVTSVEELMRTLPQNLATIGAITNNRTRGPLTDSNQRPTVSAIGALGVSAANLGGIGAGNTLVLVNGRRLAGAAGIEQGFVNLNGIPLSAVERVEISTGGASAIYGADALGGVINFILRSNYVGTTLTAQRLYSSAGADVSRLSAYSGYAWGSGSLSGSLDYSRRQPVVNRKTGYVTNNYAPLFGGNSLYDKRSFQSGAQPGVIPRPAIFDPDTGEQLQPESALALRPGVTGVPGINDFVPVGLDQSRDYVPRLGGPRSNTISGNLTFEQKITDKLRVFANGLASLSKNRQEDTVLQGIALQLAPGQAYNPFPAYATDPFSPAITVNYFPAAELADGSLPRGSISNTSYNWSINAGVGYDVTSRMKIELIYTGSSGRTKGRGEEFASIVQLVEDPSSPNGVRCANSALDNNQVLDTDRKAYQASFDRQCLALTSSDPSVAFNPFRSGSTGGGDIRNFLVQPLQDNLRSTLQNFEGRVTGSAFSLPAGEINYALGGEYARTKVTNRLVNAIAGNAAPDRYAVFAEMTIPVLGKDASFPLARRLLFNLAARRDVTTISGPIGTVDDIPVDQGGKVITAKNRFGRTTPAFGVLWSPFNALDLRFRYTTGFKAPPATQLFSTLGSLVSPTRIYNDPLYTCTTDCDPTSSTPSYIVPSRLAPNPDLRPQTSVQLTYSASWHPGGALSGLNLAATYNYNRIRNEFATLRDLYRFYPVRQLLQLPMFYPRDSTGKIIEERDIRYNVIGSTYKSLTLEASYLFQTGLGSFEPRIVFVRNFVADSLGFDRSFVDSRVGTLSGPDRYRAVGSVQWNYKGFSTNLFVYHTPSYLNDYLSYINAGRVSNPELITPVRALTTVDLSVAWRATGKLNLQLAGRNILKAKAPFTVVDQLPYDTGRYDVTGRSVSFQVQYSF